MCERSSYGLLTLAWNLCRDHRWFQHGAGGRVTESREKTGRPMGEGETLFLKSIRTDLAGTAGRSGVLPYLTQLVHSCCCCCCCCHCNFTWHRESSSSTAVELDTINFRFISQDLESNSRTNRRLHSTTITDIYYT